jgi:fructosamine-3-kinase
VNPAGRVARLTGTTVTGLREIGGQHLWRHYRGTLADGREIFAKISERCPSGIFRSEASGLRWIADTTTVPVPEVLGCDQNALVLSWVPEDRPTAAAAERFGRDLARLHACGADAFGAPWPGFIASLPLDNSQARGPAAWPQWFATRRLLPFLRRAADAGALTREDVAPVEAVIARIDHLAGPPEPPSRIHGDCWWGNVLWSGGRGWLIDPAAHGAHRESDLAFLALFSPPHLDRTLAAYAETFPLGHGWQSRVPLHQLHPLLVHAALFGRQYAGPVRAAARAALTA